MKFFEKKTWMTSQQQTKFRREKFNMIHLKSFTKCLVTYKILQNLLARSTTGILTLLTSHYFERSHIMKNLPFLAYIAYIIL